jgi:hypothetical protein
MLGLPVPPSLAGTANRFLCLFSRRLCEAEDALAFLTVLLFHAGTGLPETRLC